MKKIVKPILVEMPKVRNPFAVLAKKRNAGSHRKTNKSMRQALKTECKYGGVAQRLEQLAFNQ